VSECEPGPRTPGSETHVYRTISIPLIFQCRLFGDTPYHPARGRPPPSFAPKGNIA